MRSLPALLALFFCLATACSDSTEPGAVRLVDIFTEDMVEGRPSAPASIAPRTEWRFEDAVETGGFTAMAGISGLSIEEGLLAGRSTSETPILHVERTTELDSRDQLHSIEVRMRVSRGANLAIETSGQEELNPDRAMQMLDAFDWGIATPIVAGEQMRTYTLRSPRPRAASEIRHIFIRPSDAADADFAIESVRVVFRKEHLASIESGVSFEGMSEIYRESLVSRAPERIRLPLDLPERPWLDLALGTVDSEPVTFRVFNDGGDVLLEQTLTTPYRWEHRRIDLSDFAGRSLEITLALDSENEGAIGIWGTPVVRQSTAARNESSPRGVILLWADTLRRDHLKDYGYERETAPVLHNMAAEGVLFLNNVSQATWTKVSTPSIMTSLYPSTHGVKDFSDYLPASAVTLAEVYREAGYATVSFASNLFTGQFTNLHQGFEELHEDGSLPEQGSSKTSREYIDRLTRWLELHADVPFFAFVHLYDPHDPFEPRPPFDSLWADPALKEKHEKELEKVREFIEEPLAKAFGMPSRAELELAGVDPEAYVAYDRDWYDGSIRGMDVEIGRLFERLRGLGIDGSTLVVFASDHGEEFLEHGRTFHGQSVYGELTGVPLIMRWPDGFPAGVAIDATTQTIDVMPTLLTLSGLAVPEEVQGRSLVPLITGDGGRWQSRPAISEKAKTRPGEGAPWPADTESYAIFDDGWKLIHHRLRRDGAPEYELFKWKEDPLDQNDLAAENPDIVDRLAKTLDGWHKMANGAKLAPDTANPEGLSQQQLERLRSLGYIR